LPSKHKLRDALIDDGLAPVEPGYRPAPQVWPETPNPTTIRAIEELEGVKFDQGKDPWHLAPIDAFRAIIKVLAFGAKKYAPRNWEKGMDWSRPYGALQRHLNDWWEGQDKDPETRMSHLWHAGCCVCFLIAYEIRGIGKDDRPHQPTT